LVDGALTATDPDTANLTGATVNITSGFASGDTLGFVNQLGITASFNAATGVLTLSGSAVPHDYEIALRAVTFSNGNSATAGTRTISFSLNDGAAVSNTATKQISVQKNTSLLAGDFTLDGHVNGADVSAMLLALADLNAFKTNHVLSATDLIAIGDVNHDGAVTNSDLQSLLGLLIGGGGSGATASEIAVNASRTSAGSVSNSATIPASAKPTVLVAPTSDAAIVTVHEPSAPVRSTLQTPAAWSDIIQSNRLVPAAVDQTLRSTIVFRSRHVSWGPAKPGSDDASASETLSW
jgi:hypothetical protein